MRYVVLLALLLLSHADLYSQDPPAKAAHRGQPTLIYKTRRDYRHLVPVLLSPDKTTIIAYPGPTDIYYDGKLALPVQLRQGYLLDNRGIGPNVAFLDITYRDYAKRTDVPALEELTRHLLDKDPLTVLYDCGPRTKYTNVVSALNRVIKTNRLRTFKKLK